MTPRFHQRRPADHPTHLARGLCEQRLRRWPAVSARPSHSSPELAPDVVILDPRLPDGDGLDICRKLHAANISARYLILTADTDPHTMLGAVHAGASGYLIKDLTEHALAETIKAIATGRSHLDGHTGNQPNRQPKTTPVKTTRATTR